MRAGILFALSPLQWLIWAMGQWFTLVGFVFIQQHHNAGHSIGTCGVESPKAMSQFSGHHRVQSITSFWV